MSAAPAVDLTGLDPEPEPLHDISPDTLDDVQIDRVLGRLRELRAEVANVERIAAERVADIERWLDERKAVLAAAIDHRLALCQAWHEHRLAKDPKAKTIPLPSGTLKSRAQGERIEVTDAAEFVGWAQVHAPELVREVVRHEPAKKELPGPLRVAESQTGPVVVDPSTGEPVPGVAWRPPSRSFSVETVEAEDGVA